MSISKRSKTLYVHYFMVGRLRLTGPIRKKVGSMKNPFITIHVLRNCISPIIRNKSNIILSSRSQECNIIKK